jgi:aryl-alcohol dehydrogenase-like predicted oxidoreductase
VLISTKAGLRPIVNKDGIFGVEVEALTKANISRSVEKSLERLETDHVDLFQLHAFDDRTPISETLGVLEDLKKQGKIRAYGCSNYGPEQLESTLAQGAGFSSCQVHYNLIERRAEEKLSRTCEAKGIGMICNRALARGLLSGKYKKDQPVPEGSRAATSQRIRRTLDVQSLDLVATLERYAASRGHSAVELALAWLLSRKFVAVVLIGARDARQLEGCVKALEWKLSGQDLSQIDQLIERSGQMPKVLANPETFFEK